MSSDGGLHIRYRPQTFEEVWGNEATVQALKAVLQKPDDKRPRVFLFHGPAGCGKTTLARLIQKYFNISEMDFMEINAASQRGINEARHLIEIASVAPVSGQYRMFLLDEAHQLTGAAAQSLLKFLEDTPPHVIVALCTTEPDMILDTIKSRCTTFKVSPLPVPTMVKFLKHILEKEQKTLPPKVLKRIVQSSNGSPRTALVLLDSIIDLESEDLMLDLLESAVVNDASTSVRDLCQALLECAGWDKLRGILKNLDGDPEQLRRAILGYMSSVLLNSENQWAALVLDEFSKPYTYVGKAGLIRDCYNVYFTYSSRG